MKVSVYLGNRRKRLIGRMTKGYGDRNKRQKKETGIVCVRRFRCICTKKQYSEEGFAV